VPLRIRPRKDDDEGGKASIRSGDGSENLCGFDGSRQTGGCVNKNETCLCQICGSEFEIKLVELSRSRPPIMCGCCIENGPIKGRISCDLRKAEDEGYNNKKNSEVN
jgi:hypothetical protein